MSSTDPFKQVEAQYYALRGQFDAKRITRAQYEAALKDLMVQDEQGRYWMLGAQSGAWYVYDGQQWVQDTPPGYGAVPYSSTLSPAIEPTMPVPPSLPPAAPPSSRGATLIPLLIAGVALVLLVALGAVFVLSQQNSPAVVQYITATPLPQDSAPPTATQLVAVAATATQPPTALPATATSIPPTPTRVQPTLPPPTLTPVSVQVPPTAPPEPTSVPPTNAPASTSTPALNFPPGVYVMQLVTSPAPAKRGQKMGFTVTFVNTTGAPQSYNWRVQIYYQDNGKRMGETHAQPVTIPPGVGQFTTPNDWGVDAKGGCISFFARAQYINPETVPVPFTNPEGNVPSYDFQLCP